MRAFVVALPSEARPLIAHYRLVRPSQAAPFKIFQRDDVWLIISGPGKVAAAAATAHLHAVAGVLGCAAWLNVGIAGHGDHAVGQAAVAHKIRDRASGQLWYPPQLLRWGCATAEVVTVDRPEQDFAEPVLYDMEASGFYATACRFATSELVQCLKIVSDNRTSPARDLTPQRIEGLIGKHLGLIDGVAAGCASLAAEVAQLEAPPPAFEALVADHHFTVSDRHRLRRLLQRWQALAPERPLPREEWAALRRGKEINQRLAAWLDALPITLGR